MNPAIHKPVLIVIAGPNGSGKTTITSKILRHEWLEGAVYINPDIVAQEKFGDWNSMDAVKQSVEYCEELRERCLRDHQSLIFETVLSAEDKIDFIKRAKEAGFFIRLFFVSTEHPSVNASRIARRVMKGGHDVPISKIVSRYYKSIVNCFKASKYADRTYVYDNTAENTEAQILFRMIDGKLAKQYLSELPKWSEPILGIM
jgi:predicted ABC-type ATPase